jgi:hypothetical protein
VRSVIASTGTRAVRPAAHLHGWVEATPCEARIAVAHSRGRSAATSYGPQEAAASWSRMAALGQRLARHDR